MLLLSLPKWIVEIRENPTEYLNSEFISVEGNCLQKGIYIDEMPNGAYGFYTGIDGYKKLFSFSCASTIMINENPAQGFLYFLEIVRTGKIADLEVLKHQQPDEADLLAVSEWAEAMQKTSQANRDKIFGGE